MVNSGMVELTVAGSFRTIPGTDKERQQFNDLKIVVPRCKDGLQEDKIHIYTSFAVRCFPIAKQADKQLNKINFEGLIKISIYGIKPVDGFPLCLGKDIKNMSWEELQHMACCLVLSEIPKMGEGKNLYQAREKAYETYMKVIKKRKIIKTDIDIKRIEENIRRLFERSGLTEEELKEKISEQMKDTFDMRTNGTNQYMFLKQPPIIAIKEWIEKASETE